MKRVLNVLALGFSLLAGGCGWTADIKAPLPEPVDQPLPPFFENFGRSTNGTVIENVTVKGLDGKEVHLHDVLQGRSNLLAFVGSPQDIDNGGELFLTLNGFATRYRDQGLNVTIIATASPEQVRSWLAQIKDKPAVSVVLDPAGPFPEMSPQQLELATEMEKAMFYKKTDMHFGQTVSMRLLGGGGMIPSAHYLMLDADRKVLGWTGGAYTEEGMGNLLLRSGIQLVAKDQPGRVWTHDETRGEERIALVKAGTLAPDFTVKDAAGREVKLSDFRGKVVVLDFWATWCGPCNASMPHMQEISRVYKDQDVVVLAVCTEDSRKSFDNWIKKNQADLPGLVFAHDMAERKPERVSHALYGVGGIPQYFVIDREGRVVATPGGYAPGEVILDGALVKAGVKVEPQIVAQAEADLEKRKNGGFSGQVTEGKGNGRKKGEPVVAH